MATSEHLDALADHLFTFSSLLSDDAFLGDWELQHLLELAVQKFGSLTADRCFCLRMPGVFGGKYVLENIAPSRGANSSRWGDMAHQIKDVPDGAKLELKIPATAANGCSRRRSLPTQRRCYDLACGLRG